MERNIHLEKFVKSKIARLTAAVALTSGAVAIAPDESRDPVVGPVDSAKHLVLESPHSAYDQLVDIIDIHKAEAQNPPPVEVTLSSNNGWAFEVQSPDGVGEFVSG